VLCMQKGVPILRSALIGCLRLELTYRETSAQERTDVSQREEQAYLNPDTNEHMRRVTRSSYPG
jgi:hypothetical protein